MTPVDLTAGMPAHFSMPEEFLSAAAWSHQRGFARDGYAFLSKPDAEGAGGVFLNDPEGVGWDGYLKDPDRLWYVASTGGDGSSICLWLDDSRQQHVVHHGSGSGSVLFAFMPSALAVLRLFAVGYQEPCWNGEWAEPASEPSPALDAYRDWLRERWAVDQPPRTGLEAIGVRPDDPDAEAWLAEGPPNPFATWLDQPGALV